MKKTCITYFILTIGVLNMRAQNKTDLYPNPNNGIFTVHTSGLEVSHFEIYNVLGEIVFKSEIKNSQTEIDLSFQPKGIYFIRISTETDNNLLTKKLIVR